MDVSGNLLTIWAKRSDQDGLTAVHPLLFHLADVAAVAELMWGYFFLGLAHDWCAPATIHFQSFRQGYRLFRVDSLRSRFLQTGK